MDEKRPNTSNVLLNLKPPIAADSTLLVNKNIRTLEDIRKSFSPVKSSVLNEVRGFLPKLATANDDLQKKIQADPEYSVDIEQIEDSDAPHIEMNLALVEADYSSEDSSLDSDTSTDSEDDNTDLIGEVNESNIKLSKQKVKHTHGKQLIETIDGEKECKTVDMETLESDGI